MERAGQIAIGRPHRTARSAPSSGFAGEKRHWRVSHRSSTASNSRRSQTYWRIAAFDLRLRIEYICASGIDDRLDRLLVEIELCLVRWRSERLRFIRRGHEGH